MTGPLTGEYPDWWKGRRFGQPTMAWAARLVQGRSPAFGQWPAKSMIVDERSRVN
jgi:hypothetical protein